METEAELTIEAVTIAKESSQANEVVDDLFTPDDCLQPPLSLAQLAKLTAQPTVRRQIIEAVVLNTVGLGWTLGPAAAVDQPDDQALKGAIAEATDRLNALAMRDVRLDNPTFTELIKAVKWDEEEVGQGFFEVSRDRRNGQIDGLYHAPGKRMRRLKDRTGYVLVPPDGDTTKGIRFYNFGSKVQADADGKPTSRLAPGKTWATNEILAFKLYSSENRDYGMPRDAQMALDYLGDQLAAQSNVSFFDSSGVPPTILFVQGEETRQGTRTTFRVPQETATRIAATLKSDSGHQHRVAIIPVPPGTSTKEVKLGERSDRDMGFTEFRGDNRDRALSAFRLQPIFIGAQGDGRYDAEVQRSITLEQVFDPEQERYEQRLRHTLLRDLGYGQLALKFKRLAVEGDAMRRESAERSAEVGAITYREFRDAHGHGPFTGANAHLNDEVIVVAAPKGADNRVNAAADQRGLKPGIGGRTSRDKATGNPRHVEQQVTQLADKLNAAQTTAAQRAASRARSA